MRLSCLFVLMTSLLAGAEIRTLTGESVEAAELRLDATTLTVGDRVLPLETIDWLQLAPLPDLPQARAVLLADGGFLPIEDLQPGKDDQVVCLTRWGDVQLPLGDAVLGWGPVPWLQAQVPQEGVDQLLIGGAEGASQQWPGELIGLSGGALEFDARGVGPVAKPLAEVVGLRLGIPVRQAGGLRLRARPQADLGGFDLVPVAAGGATLVGGLGHLDRLPEGRLRVLGGRRVFLSELDPVVVEEEGAFGVVWPWRRDENLDGSPLVLDGQRYEAGVVVHSRCRLVWELGKAYSRFDARIGIADLVGHEGDCEVQLRGDGKELWSHKRLRGGERPHHVQVGLDGVDRLELLVEFGQRYDIGDHVALADAWLLKQ